MPKKTAAKKAAFGTESIEGMKLVLAHERGRIELEQVWPRPIDIKAIRKRVKMSQTDFSRIYCIGKRAPQEWEQGGRQTDSAARAYLMVIAKEPAVVRRVLASGYRSPAKAVTAGTRRTARLFRCESAAGDLFDVGSVHALDAIEQPAKGFLRIHCAQLLVREHLQMCFPFGLKFRVEDISFEDARGVQIKIAGHYNAP